jgi:hypothetical protein
MPVKNIAVWLARRLPIGGITLCAAMNAHATTIGMPENLGVRFLNPTPPARETGRIFTCYFSSPCTP